MAFVSIKVTEKYQLSEQLPQVPLVSMFSLGQRCHRSSACTQNNITSLPMQKNSIGLWLPNSESQISFSLRRTWGKLTGIGQVGLSIQPNSLGRDLAVGKATGSALSNGQHYQNARGVVYAPSASVETLGSLLPTVIFIYQGKLFSSNILNAQISRFQKNLNHYLLSTRDLNSSLVFSYQFQP